MKAPAAPMPPPSRDALEPGQLPLRLALLVQHPLAARVEERRVVSILGALEQAQHQIPAPGRAGPGQQVVERFEPLGGLVGVDVGQVRRDTLPDHPDPVGISGAG